MAKKKLGYTWYPKDWGNSESVFELTLSERGLYRELIDMAMLNDNQTEIKKDVWSRKFAVSLNDLEIILQKLTDLGLIICKKTTLFIPSCESRLVFVRTGSVGGSNKGNNKGNDKGLAKGNDEGNANQREKEIKIETKIESESILNDSLFKELLISESWIEVNAKNNRTTPDKVKAYLTKFNNNLIAQGEKKNNKREYMSHFARWLPIELSKEVKDKPKFTPLI